MSLRPSGTRNRRTAVVESGKAAWRRIFYGWRDQGCSQGGFLVKTGVTVFGTGPNRREEDRLQVHETNELGLSSAVGDEPERVRFPRWPGAGPMTVVRVLQLLQAQDRAAADAPVSRADRSRRLALRFLNHPDHGAGGQDEQEHGAGQGLHGVRVCRTEPGRNEEEGKARKEEIVESGQIRGRSIQPWRTQRTISGRLARCPLIRIPTR